MTAAQGPSGLVVPDVAQPRVLAVAERLLVRSDAAGVLPTPLDAVASCAGIEEVLDVSQLPPPLAARKPSFLRRVVGALWYRESVAFIDYSQPDARARFIEAHEIGHRALPWHRASHELFQDDEGTLHPDTELELEAEANLLAAHLLFQGHRFHQQALDRRCSPHSSARRSPPRSASTSSTIPSRSRWPSRGSTEARTGPCPSGPPSPPPPSPPTTGRSRLGFRPTACRSPTATAYGHSASSQRERSQASGSPTSSCDVDTRTAGPATTERRRSTTSAACSSW